MVRNDKLKVLSMALILLNGCSNSGGNGGSIERVPTTEEALTLENPVRLDQLGVLPASNSSAASYLLQLTNYSKDKYTLDSARVIDLDTGKDSTLVSVASQACSTVSANGSCSIQLTPHTSQSADVKLEVNLKDKFGVSTILVQLIRISGDLNANNGGIVMLNDVDRVITEDGNYSLSIPVILGDDYDDIKASNGSLICNTDGYQKGSSCTYQLSGKVAAGTSAVVSTRLEGIKAGKTMTVQEANTKVEVAKGAHLLLSHGTNINDPATSGEITVFNSGNIEATSIVASVEAASGLRVATASANACGTNLAANDTCKVKVSVISTINGQGSVKVAYKDNGADNTAQTNVGYKLAAANAGVTFTESSNNLANAIVGGKTREALVSVKNIGNRTLEGVSYYLTAAGNSGLTLEKAASNGCNLTGTTLAANESCNLSVKYKPTAAQLSKSINLVLNGKYTDQNGQSHALVSAQGLTYSASIAGSGNLAWNFSSNANIMILSDGQEVESVIWRLTNSLAADEGLSAKNVNVSLNPSTINGLKLTPIDAAKCTLNNAEIVGSSACQYKVSYGPTRDELKQTEVDLKANYNFYAGTIESSSAKFIVASSAVPQPKIEVVVKMDSGATVVTGAGTNAAPWSFTTYNDETISLQYEFKNFGTLKADRFNINAGNLPRGAVLRATTCPIGVDASDLARGASCTADIDIPDPQLFAIPNLVMNSLNSATLKLDLPYSYRHNGNLYRGQSDTTYVNFKRLWANVAHEIQATASTESAYEFDVLSKVTPIDAALKSYPITVTPTLAHPIAGVQLTPCTIADQTKDSCTNKISLPKNMFIAGKKLLVTFKTSANGLDVKDTIVSDYNIITDWLTDLTIEPLGKFTTEDSTYILTAAHCLKYKSEITPIEREFWSWDGKLIARGKGTLYVPPERINPPQGHGGASTDIAIMKLPKIAVPTYQDGGIVEQPILYDGSNEKGSVVEFVGYGIWGVALDPNGGYGPANGPRRLWGASIIDRIFEADHGIGATYVPKGKTEYWARSSSGDSGSAWWQDHQGRKVIIATTNGHGSTHSTGARVSKYIPWILSIYPQARILSKVVNEPLVLKRSDHIPNAAINGNDVVVQKAASLNPL
jgi:hypothetical protein